MLTHHYLLEIFDMSKSEITFTSLFSVGLLNLYKVWILTCWDLHWEFCINAHKSHWLFLPSWNCLCLGLVDALLFSQKMLRAFFKLFHVLKQFVKERPIFFFSCKIFLGLAASKFYNANFKFYYSFDVFNVTLSIIFFFFLIKF